MHFIELEIGSHFTLGGDLGGREYIKLGQRVRQTGSCADCANPGNSHGNSVSLDDGSLHFFDPEELVQITRLGIVSLPDDKDLVTLHGG